MVEGEDEAASPVEVCCATGGEDELEVLVLVVVALVLVVVVLVVVVELDVLASETEVVDCAAVEVDCDVCVVASGLEASGRALSPVLARVSA